MSRNVRTRLRGVRCVLVLTAAILSSSLVHGQDAIKSARPSIYQGAQPDLVQGVRQELPTGQPLVRHAYLAAPDVLAFVVDSQAIITSPAQKYVKQPGDEIKFARPIPYGPEGTTPFYWGRTIIRDGKEIGDIVGPNQEHFQPRNLRAGEPLDTAWAEQLSSYSVTSTDDPAFRQGITPVSVSRKTKAESYDWVDGKQQPANRHELFLKLPAPLTPGKNYTLRFNGSKQLTDPLTIKFDDKRLRTEAIQVNQVGYHPRQPERLARMSMWTGSGGGIDFGGLKTFHVVDDKTSAVVYTGEIKLRKAGLPGKEMPPERTDDPTDETPVSVYLLNFSAFSKPGTYRIVVPGLGSSFPFSIDEKVWETSAKMSAHGFLNQRSGIALGPPYTEYVRPRNFHPADGVPIHRCDPKIFFDPVRFPAGSGNAFKRIAASIQLDTNVPEAWGGWHDAADYDRSILPQQHTRGVHIMLWLAQSNPAYYEKLNLNLPESGNGIPDIVNEALWCTELFRRIQEPDGGVPSAVESIEHPSEPSFLHALPTAITPPTPQTCYQYAAVASRMSVVLVKYNADLSKAYRESALRAMDWAEKNSSVPNIYAKDQTVVDKDAAMAYVWLYGMTSDAKWHDAFKATLVKLYPTGQINQPEVDRGGPRPFMDYLSLPESKTDAALRDRCKRALLAIADAKVKRINDYTYFLRAERYNWDERLGQHWELAEAHRLTGDPKYILAMERQADLGLGSNPSNTSYTTGLGSRQVVPYNIDANYLGVPIPYGLGGIGPAPRNSWAGSRIEPKTQKAGLYPEWKFWPWAESNFNHKEPMINENVVGGGYASLLLTRAYLAQTYASPAKK